MTKGRVSILIPARQEPQLLPTVKDCLAQATGDIEVIVALDGAWPDQFVNDTRVHYLHWGEAKGLRPSLNAAVAMATGEFLFKLDGHCALAKGYDEVLKNVCGDGEIAVPEKYSLKPEDWTRFRDPWRHFYYLWPWQTGEDGHEKFVGLQDRNYDPKRNAELDAKFGDNILAYQGSAWMIRRQYWDRLMPNGMDAAHYYYAAEPVEVGLKAIMSGGRVKMVTQAWYAHLHKGSGVHKRQFSRQRDPWDAAMRWATKHWMTDSEPGMTRTFASVVEQFGPMPGWPDDWFDDAQRRFRDDT